MNTTTPEEIKNFNDLCKVVIYHYADCMEHATASAKRLVKAGIMTDTDDASSAYDDYQTKVIDYAKDHLPKGWDVTHDYWGAKCFALNPKWAAPKEGTLFAGDKSGYIMFFDSFQALEEYTKEKVKELEQTR